jgi:hypothetical protein
LLIIEYSPIEIIPLIPTNEYTILLNILIVPNKVATKSKLKRPIRSQLSAPTITRVRAILYKVFINVNLPKYLFIIIIFKYTKNIQKVLKYKALIKEIHKKLK